MLAKPPRLAASARQPLSYARVSTVGQTVSAQVEQLKAAGCGAIYREVVSGATADRKELGRLLKQMQPGDVVMVTAVDRLARSIFDLFAIVSRIKAAGAVFARCGSRGPTQRWRPGA